MKIVPNIGTDSFIKKFDDINILAWENENGKMRTIGGDHLIDHARAVNMETNMVGSVSSQLQ